MIEFILNRKKIKTEIPSGENLLQFIRENEHLKGTKIGCREGDCGACTVLVGTLQPDGQMVYKTLTSCLASLASVAGKHVVTVEGLNLENQLNKAQQAMHEHFATQCGFCTPGFVVSLTNAALEHHEHSTKSIDAISGNICRCTGYKSIEKAAHQMDEKLGDVHHDLDWYIEKQFIPEYFKGIPATLKELNSEVSQGKRLVSGGTDVYVREADSLADVDINYFTGNQSIERQENRLSLGGNVTVSQLEHSPEMNVIFPKLKDYLKLVSSHQIRNMATLAGNIVNASPIGDLSIFFLALNAQLTLVNNQHSERKVLLKDFFKGYKLLDLQPNEWIQSVDFQIPEENSFFNFEKVSKRTHLDIASVNSAIYLEMNRNTISKIHLSMGGVYAIPFYLKNTVEFLTNKELTVDLLKEAVQILQSEIAPIDDIRGSVTYKRLLARQLFFAHFLQVFPSKFSLTDLL